MSQTLSTSQKNSSWFKCQGYAQGIFWIFMVALTSNTNDILMRFAGSRLPAMEIAFFRFFFATLTLLPVMLYFRKEGSFYTKRPSLHLLRSILLFGAIACWTTGLTMVPLAAVSTFAQTTQLFVLPMAAIFLKEQVGWQRSLATLAGFMGILLIVVGHSGNDGFFDSLLSLNNGTLFLISAAMMFALSDILNKRFVVEESTLSMMFYIALGTTLFGAYPAYTVWQTPELSDLGILLVLGAGGNLILFFLLKAFAATDVSALAPFRYLEMILAGIFGFLIFGEIPCQWTLAGAAIIVPSTFAIAYYETHHKRKAVAPEPPKPVEIDLCAQDERA